MADVFDELNPSLYKTDTNPFSQAEQFKSEQLGAGLAWDNQTFDVDGNIKAKSLELTSQPQISALPSDNLQVVLNRLNEAGGGTLLLGPHTYTLNNAITGYSNVAITGVSPSATILDFNSTSANLSFAGTNVYTTGTITSIAFGVNVTGSGTSWLTNASAGQYLFIGTRHYKIAAVTGDTTLVLEEGYTDDVTMPGAAYRIATTIVDVKLSNFGVKSSTGTGIVFTDAVQIQLDNVTDVLSNKGFAFTNVSRLNIDRVLNASSTSNGFEFTNVGLSDWESVNSVSAGGHGFVLNNVKTVAGLLSSDASTSDGFNFTDVDRTIFILSGTGNGGQGLELVSGSDENDIDGNFIGNASDGVKLTATSDRNHIKGIYKGNGGYGINIAAASDDDNTIDVPTFSGNSSGDYNDSGTNTNIVATITSADVQTFTANDTWTKPANAKQVTVACFGGGGGGAGGNGSTRGGTGGGGGAYTTRTFNAADLGATESITVGSGGAGGASATNGSPGGSSSFGSFLSIYGGGGGRSATTTASGGGGGGTAGVGAIGASTTTSLGGSPATTSGANGISGQGAGGVETNAHGNNGEYGGGSGGGIAGSGGGVVKNGGSSLYGAGGGGGGGFESNENAGAGGKTNSYTAGGGGAAGATSGAAGADGGTSNGGGGGHGSVGGSGAGGNGGAGGIRGGGGGGGGAGASGTGGTGGTGGRGEVVVYTTF